MIYDHDEVIYPQRPFNERLEFECSEDEDDESDPSVSEKHQRGRWICVEEKMARAFARE